MYLKKLYTANKGWFIAIMLFIFIQLGLDIKQAIDFSPAFHYGMYSGVIKPRAAYDVTEVWVNGKRLATQDFNPCGWDKVIQPVKLFSSQQSWNRGVWNNDIKRLLHFKDSTRYINSLTELHFKDWYVSYLQSFLHEKIDSIKIATTVYSFTGTQLVKNTTGN